MKVRNLHIWIWPPLTVLSAAQKLWPNKRKLSKKFEKEIARGCSLVPLQFMSHQAFGAKLALTLSANFLCIIRVGKVSTNSDLCLPFPNSGNSNELKLARIRRCGRFLSPKFRVS